ncbi:MAG TPA: MBL fold metallo-hydrolase [Candidatus Baltobacteraceae bacterium]
MKLSRVLTLRAPNPSAMTLDGTNTYLLDAGNGAAVVIDPGPNIEAHIQRMVGAAGERGLHIVAIAVTHGHPDHAPGAAPLAQRTGAPVYAHQNATFPHSRSLSDGETLRFEALSLLAVDAPGHARDHLVFWYPQESALFTGDTVIGRGTVVIAPPQGDMRAYVRTLRRLRDEFPDAQRLYGGHGDPIDTPRAKLDEYLAHRATREAQVLAELANGARTIPELVARLYSGLAPVLQPAAARQLLAHLIALEDEGLVWGSDVARPQTQAERALLNPDLSQIVPPEELAVTRAELGLDEAPRLLEYALTRARDAR